MAEEVDESGGGLHPMLIVFGAAVVTLVVLVGAFAVFVHDPAPVRHREVEAAATARAWLHAWADDDRDAMRKLVAGDPPALAGTVEDFRSGVRPEGITTDAGPPVLAGDEATVAFTADVALPAFGPWSYDGTLTLVDVDVPVDGESGEGDNAETERQWRVRFSPATLHPDLTDGRRLALARTWGPRGQLLATDGTPLPDTSPLRSIVGRVGPATAAQAEALGPDHEVGDPVGQSGLQAGMDAELAGRPRGEIRLVEGDRVVKVEAAFPGEPGVSVRTSLDLRVLESAQAALGAAGNPAALVAIQPSTGAIRAVANRPANGFDRALAGRYPPGSTMKVVTTMALLANGTTPDTRVACPPDIRVDGRTIRNAEEEELGDISFRDAFVHSCNTAFIALAEQLPSDALVQAARAVGFDADPGLRTGAATSQFPETVGPIDQVSAAIGQGRVLATPLQMASVAATVAAGGYRKPFLVVPPTPVPFAPMSEGAPAILQDLMRGVVSSGTGTKARLPGAPVAGKTGTAEFGTAVPLRTHAWFIAFRNDLAVAVVVEDGGFGGTTAAPIVADFLRRVG